MTNSYNPNQNKLDDEIDLKLILNFLIRNKFLIFLFTFVIALLFSAYALIQKKVWMGNFEIVIDDKRGSSSSLIDAFNSLGNFGGVQLSNSGKSSSSSINTEVGILESPSILMPIFEYVSERKKEEIPDSKLFFNNWKENLKVKVKPKTSILNISYKDSDKSIILPVLEKISSAYQDYSGRSKKRNIELTKNYLNDQINLYQIKSSKSLRIAQDFAIEQDLSMLNINKNNNSELEKQFLKNLPQNYNVDIQSTENLLANTEIENIRVNAANEIKTIDLKIKRIEELNPNDNYESIQYIVSSLPNFDSELQSKLQELDISIGQINSKYTGKDDFSQSLNEQRLQLVDLIKKRTLGFLKMRRLSLQATMESATRPKGVILKYKKLIREASRDENTLIELEDQLRMINLEESRLTDPWELITKPTLQLNAVEPNKISIGLIGILVGLISGVVYSFYKERKSDLIIEVKYLEEMLGIKIADTLDLNSKDFKNYSEKVLFNEIINIYSKDKIKFVCVGNLLSESIEIFKNLVDEFFKNKKDLNIKSDNFFTNDLFSLSDSEKIVLITSLKSLKYSDIRNFKNRLSLNNKKIYSCILLD